ncbi:YggS family pyridoxal phosphate-dependent enzyme [soil metagenome]
MMTSVDASRSAGDADIPARLAAVTERIARAARDAGRDPGDVRLVAVSKFHALRRIAAAHAAGQVAFGESRAQELDAKLADGPPDSLWWHFVGSLQRNKVRLVAGRVALIHSVDRPALATAIAAHMQELGACQDVLVQVNVAGEQRKSGCAPAQVLELAETIARLDGIRVTGLMAIPPLHDDPAPVFAELRALRVRVAEMVPGVVELSMGMSGDLESAVVHGATIVRIGTAIFGARPRNR